MKIHMEIPVKVQPTQYQFVSFCKQLNIQIVKQNDDSVIVRTDTPEQLYKLGLLIGKAIFRASDVEQNKCFI